MGGEPVLTRSRLLDHDPQSGVIRKFHGGSDGDTFVESIQQGVGPLMRENAEIRKRTDGQKHTAKGRLGTLVGRYPLAMWEDWVRQGIVTTGGKVLDEARWAKVISDPDTSNFRTTKGRFF